MARQSKRLTARGVIAALPPGLHADGDGLYLVVDKVGNRRWSFIYQWHGKRRELGLGPLAKVGLADARELAAEQRRHLGLGTDPKEARKAASEARKAVKHTFGSFADVLIADLKSQFRNAKHIAQWEMTLKVYAAPLRSMPLDAIETTDVLKVLKPIWHTKAETASRLRGRIERVLDAAKAQGLRSGENPARWRGHLDSLLPKRQKLTRGHHAAMPYAQLPAFYAALLAEQSLSARALEWTILAACRSGEALGARWDEINWQSEVWTVPAERMKAGRPHRVPLTPRMLEILDALKETAGDNPFIFAGSKPKRPLSDMAMAMQMRRMGFGEFTVHGFRSAFRDWAAEETQFPRETAEAALAHIVGDATERAYRRGDALERRRALMQIWQQFTQTFTDSVVVALRPRQGSQYNV